MDGLIKDLDRLPGTIIIRAEELPSVIAAARGNATVAARLWSLYGVLALGIATFAIVSMVHQNANRRRLEIGIRLALGATQRRIFRVVAGEVLFASSVGAAVGAGITLASASVVQQYVGAIEFPGISSLTAALAMIVILALVASIARVLAVLRVSPTELMRSRA